MPAYYLEALTVTLGLALLAVGLYPNLLLDLLK